MRQRDIKDLETLKNYAKYMKTYWQSQGSEPPILSNIALPKDVFINILNAVCLDDFDFTPIISGDKSISNEYSEIVNKALENAKQEYRIEDKLGSIMIDGVVISPTRNPA